MEMRHEMPHNLAQKLYKPSNIQDIRAQEMGNRKYRIILKHVTREQREAFPHSKCLMPISVGQPYHEGEKLKAALKCMNQHFKEIIIIVGDTIQRYNHAASQHQTPKALFHFAETEGDKWLERNEPIIRTTLTKPYKILRWDHYRKNPEFNKRLAEIERLYQSGNPEYRFAFELDSKDFLQRACRSGAAHSNNVNVCLQYLKEECACIYLWAEENCEFLTYPEGFNNVFRATRKKFIEGTYNGIMKELPYSIKGKNINSH